MNQRIGKITDTMLGIEDHGIFTATLFMDYGGVGQGVGNLFLDDYDEATRKRVPSTCAGAFIAGVLRACGVRQWEHVKGRTIYVLFNEETGYQAIGIENLPTEPGERFLFTEIKEQP
jgi:NADH:ubiquinone oxidoreductase subunit 5 (subunit L)/multisubunit Na+/H+ antiporter MnhA subunit